MNSAFTILLILLGVSGFAVSESFAIVSPDSAFTLEGSGYAVTENTIKISGIDLALSTQKQTGSSIASSIEDGFITLDDEDFQVTELKSTILREGKYIRINGIIDNDIGNQASISFFGKLIEQSKNGSIYGLTGRITVDNDDYKIIYTAKLSELVKIKPTTESKTTDNITIHIAKGSSTQGIGTYIDVAGAKQQAASTQSPNDALRFRYFSQDRISVIPGTTITIINDDIVSHSILSGKENYGDRYNLFTADGRISTDKILPGKSISITLDEAGFYRLYDPDYQWMNMIAYVFPNVQNNVVLGKGLNSN